MPSPAATPDSSRRLLLRTVIVGLLAYGLWVCLEPTLISSLRMAADLLWPDWLPGGLKRIDPEAGHWRVHTGWPISAAPGEPIHNAIFRVPSSLAGGRLALMPMLLTLMLVGRECTLQRLFLGLLLAWLLAFSAVTLFAWHMACVMQGVTGGLSLQGFEPPPYRLLIVGPPAWQAWLSGIGWRTLTAPTNPALALMLWAVLCPRTLQTIHALICRRLTSRTRHTAEKATG